MGTDLDSLGDVDKHVGSRDLRAKAPDLTGLSHVPAVLVGKNATTILRVLLVGDITLVDVLGNTISEGHGLHIQTIVLHSNKKRKE